MVRLFTLAIVALAFFVSGCERPQPAVSASPVAPSVINAATVTRTGAATATISVTQTRTSTDTATATRAASPIATSTPVPTATVTPNVTAEAIGCARGCTASQAGCTIKGNISLESGERIYHVQGQQFYNATVIDASQGERWFCTEQEAVMNGWRRSLR
jgi:hypothetical protein